MATIKSIRMPDSVGTIIKLLMESVFAETRVEFMAFISSYFVSYSQLLAFYYLCYDVA
jgi:hypothetical protein